MVMPTVDTLGFGIMPVSSYWSIPYKHPLSLSTVGQGGAPELLVKVYSQLDLSRVTINVNKNNRKKKGHSSP